MQGVLSGFTTLLTAKTNPAVELIAVTLADAGSHLVLLGPHDAHAERIAYRIHQAGGTATCLRAEPLTPMDAATVESTTGPIDLLINILCTTPSDEGADQAALTDSLWRAMLTRGCGTIIEAGSSPLAPADGLGHQAAYRVVTARPTSSPTLRATLSALRLGVRLDDFIASTEPAQVALRVARQVVRLAIDALLAFDSTHPHEATGPSAQDLAWDAEGRAEEELNFELG